MRANVVPNLSRAHPNSGVRFGHAQARAAHRPRLPARRRAALGLVREVPAAGRAAGPEARSGRRGPSAGARPAGHYTKRTAEAWLREVLDEARRGTLPGLVQTGATFADAAAEFLRYVEHDRSTASPRRCATTARSSRRTCCRPSAPCASRTSRREKIERWRARSPRPTDRRCRTARRTSCSSCSTASSAARRRSTGCPATRSPRSSATRSARAATSRSSRVEEVYALVRAAELRAGRRHLPDRGVHRAAPRRARRAALARRRLRRRGDPRPRELRRRRADDAEVRQACAPCRWRRTSPRRSPGSASAATATSDDDLVFLGVAGGYLDALRAAPPLRPGAQARRPAAAALPRPAPHVRHADDRARPTSAACRSGWATPTSRRRCSTCTTSRATTTPPWSPTHSGVACDPRDGCSPRLRADATPAPPRRRARAPGRSAKLSRCGFPGCGIEGGAVSLGTRDPLQLGSRAGPVGGKPATLARRSERTADDHGARDERRSPSVSSQHSWSTHPSKRASHGNLDSSRHCLLRSRAPCVPTTPKNSSAPQQRHRNPHAGRPPRRHFRLPLFSALSVPLHRLLCHHSCPQLHPLHRPPVPPPTTLLCRALTPPDYLYGGWAGSGPGTGREPR